MWTGKKNGRNEFVMRLQPDEAMYMKFTVCIILLHLCVIELLSGNSFIEFKEVKFRLVMFCMSTLEKIMLTNNGMWVTGERTGLGHEYHFE